MLTQSQLDKIANLYNKTKKPRYKERIMDLIILNDGLYQLIPVTKKMLEGIELISEIDCFDLCDILRLKLTGYVDTLNLHIMKDGSGSMIGCMCK
jgi:hypothetical protein